MNTRRAVVVREPWITKARKYGIDTVAWYASPEGRRSRSRSRSGTRGTERNPVRLGIGKLGEIALAQYFSLDLEKVIKWDVTRADRGNDVKLPCGTLADVKSTEAYKRFLIWSKEVNDLYAKKDFDILVSVSVNNEDWSRCWIEGYVSKLTFWTDHFVADGAKIGKGLEPGTWGMSKHGLLDIYELHPLAQMYRVVDHVSFGLSERVR